MTGLCVILGHSHWGVMCCKGSPKLLSAEMLRVSAFCRGAGPLIRIIGDRFPWQIKAAILVTLGGLIAKAGLGLKPFVPQLQTSFLKCLQDQASSDSVPGLILWTTGNESVGLK